MSTFHQLDRLHQTTIGLLVFGLIELGVSYLFISLAIDRGNLLWYALALLFLIGALRNLFMFIGRLIDGKGKAKRTR